MTLSGLNKARASSTKASTFGFVVLVCDETVFGCTLMRRNPSELARSGMVVEAVVRRPCYLRSCGAFQAGGAGLFLRSAAVPGFRCQSDKLGPCLPRRADPGG